MRNPCKERGVTLVELIFTLAILATLLSISLPALGNLVHSAQARGARASLMTSLSLARANAVARQQLVSVCPAADQTHCDASIWWQSGWIVFVDANGNGKHDADELILETVGAQPGSAIASTKGRTVATYRTDGSATGTNLTYTLCDKRGAQQSTTLVINNGGRVRMGVPTAAQATAACAALGS